MKLNMSESFIYLLRYRVYTLRSLTLLTMYAQDLLVLVGYGRATGCSTFIIHV